MRALKWAAEPHLGLSQSANETHLQHVETHAVARSCCCPCSRICVVFVLQSDLWIPRAIACMVLVKRVSQIPLRRPIFSPLGTATVLGNIHFPIA